MIVSREDCGPNIDQISFVYECPYIFREDLLGLSLDHELKLIIEIVPDTRLISKAPYRMI